MLRLGLLWFAVLKASAHITLDPNYGAASGGYFSTTVKIPHGEQGMHTTRLVVHVPRGVLSIVPEVPHGWSANITKFTLAPEDRYTTHGQLVTTAPDKVIFQADTPEAALHNDHLLLVTLQLRLGCSFHDQVTANYEGSNSIWQGQYTLWFKMEQHMSHDNELSISSTSLWTGALADSTTGSPSWNPPSSSGLKACPYIFIHSGTSCQLDHSGTSVTGGMNWMSEYVEPATNVAQIRNEQHVVELSTEVALTVQESLAQIYSKQDEVKSLADAVQTLTRRVDALDSDNNLTLLFSILGFAMSLTAISLLLGLGCYRICAKAQFAHVICAVPLMHEHGTKTASPAFHTNSA